MERLTGRPLRLRLAGRGTLRLFDRFMREMVEMHYLLSEPLFRDNSARVRLRGPLPKALYAEGIPQTLAAAPLRRPARPA